MYCIIIYSQEVEMTNSQARAQDQPAQLYEGKFTKEPIPQEFLRQLEIFLKEIYTLGGSITLGVMHIQCYWSVASSSKTVLSFNVVNQMHF